MNRNTTTKTALLCSLLLFLLLPLLCGCGERQLLPTGGYDYRTTAVGGAILGYPIPKKETNPYRYTLPLAQNTAPAAFAFDTVRMEYTPLRTEPYTLVLPDNRLTVPSTVTDRGRTFFASASDTVRICQGDINGMAVVLSGGTLYLADETAAHPLADDVSTVWEIHTVRPVLLFSDKQGILYEYRGDVEEPGVYPCSDGMAVRDAWYAYGADRHTILFRAAEAASGWFYTEDGERPIPCVLPPQNDGKLSDVYVRGTACLLRGNSDTAYFYDIRTGNVLDMDMGGLYRFPQDTDIADLPLSPDGRFVYFYDIDFIYRLNLETGNLDLAYNEAPIFEGSCILSSMTPVTDEIVLLSQAANEYTEYVPTITCAVFEEDIPEVRHEDEKIDLDRHPWDTED